MTIRLGCKISLDNAVAYYGDNRTRYENMCEAWKKIAAFYKVHGVQLPTTKEEFLQRGGRVDWYRSY